jgi:hypothetical protein|tara:strand:- start:4723 stop:6201 length:1479 start_codon:yes stop_codon:yes gene_type:complete
MSSEIERMLGSYDEGLPWAEQQLVEGFLGSGNYWEQHAAGGGPAELITPASTNIDLTQVTPGTLGPKVEGQSWLEAPYMDPITGATAPTSLQAPAFGMGNVVDTGSAAGSITTPDMLAPPEIPQFEIPSFEKDPYSSTGVGAATDQAYNTYMSLLENTVAGSGTDRIENIYNLAMGEAARQNEAADRYEAGALANIETDSAALMENLGMLTDKFDTELNKIRVRQDERIAGSKETRNDRIDQAIEEYDLGEATATFLITGTKTSDILEAQGNRQEIYSDRFKTLYAAKSLDREMDALGLTQQAKRNVANQVLAMKENIAQFEYDAKVQNQKMLIDAETASANRANELATTLAELGLDRDLAGIQINQAEREAEEAYDADWNRSAAFLEGPFGAGLSGLTPDMISALDNNTLLAMVEGMGGNTPIFSNIMGEGQQPLMVQWGENVPNVGPVADMTMVDKLSKTGSEFALPIDVLNQLAEDFALQQGLDPDDAG